MLTFVVVQGPYQGKPFLDSVETAPLDPSDEDAVALTVRYGNKEDIIISTMNGVVHKVYAGTKDEIRMAGRVGVIRRIDGEATRFWLFDGTRLTVKDGGITNNPGRYEGVIMEVERADDGFSHNAFVTKDELPVGKSLQGMWIVVHHPSGETHGYDIDHVVSVKNKRGSS